MIVPMLKHSHLTLPLGHYKSITMNNMQLLALLTIATALFCVSANASPAATAIPKGWQLINGCQNHCAVGAGVGFKSQHLTCPACCKAIKGGKVTFKDGRCQAVTTGLVKKSTSMKCLCQENHTPPKSVKGKGGKGSVQYTDDKTALPKDF